MNGNAPGLSLLATRSDPMHTTRIQQWAVLASLGVFLPAVLTAAAPAPEADIRRDAIVTSVERVMPAVVNIATETLVEVRDPFSDVFQEFFGPYQRRRVQSSYSLGSGVII